MNETVLGQENLYLELDSVKTETEPTIYDDVVAKSATPAVEQTSYETCSRGAAKKRQASADLENACQRDSDVLRRMLFFMSAVAAVALLTAAAALFLAITAMKESQLSELRNLLKTLNATVGETADLTNKVNNISKMAGPIGPPGFNGSQGAAGPMGAIGSPGPKGAGNFSTCQYKVEEGDFTPGNPDKAVAIKTETTGRIILGATCSTNFAPEYNLISQQQPSGKWTYICNCRGTSRLFIPRGDPKNCFLHYWECPLAT